MKSLKLSLCLLAPCKIARIVASLPYDGWTQGSSLLPRPTADGAIGYNPSNNTIWLLGGEGNVVLSDNKQLISFDYILNTFKDYSTFLPQNVYGYSRNYAQIGSTLYITKSTSGSYIHLFNMETMNFTSNYLSTPFAFDALYHCVTNIRNEYLVILGYNNDVQILEIQSKLWLNSVPSFEINRRFASCIYINDKLFIIGGEDTSIEYLDVSTTSMMNIESTSWKYNNDPLPHIIKSGRSIAVNDDILVIGGYNGTYLNTVYVINSNTESVSLGGYLYKGISESCVIFVDGIIYSFGGNTGVSDKWDGWQTISMITSTTEPTAVVESTSAITATNTISTQTSSDIITTSTSTTEATNSMTTQNEPYTTTSDSITSSIDSLIQTTNHESMSTNQTLLNGTRSSIIVPIIVSTVALSYTTNSSEKASKDVNENDLWFILFVITLSMFVIFVLCGAICIWIKKRKEKKEFESSSNIMVMSERPKADDNNKNSINIKQSIELSDVKRVKKDIQGEDDSSSNDSMYDMEGIEPEVITTKVFTTTKQ